MKKRRVDPPGMGLRDAPENPIKIILHSMMAEPKRIQSMTIKRYIKNINERFKTGISREYLFQERLLSNVQFNDKQYFGNVALKAWNFHNGGYQPV